MRSIVLLAVCLTLNCLAETTTNVAEAAVRSTVSNAVVRTSTTPTTSPQGAESSDKHVKRSQECRCQGSVSGVVIFFYFICLIAGVAGIGWLVIGIEKRIRSIGDSVADGAVTAKTILRHTSGVDDVLASVEQKLNAGNERMYNAIKTLISQELTAKRAAPLASVPPPQIVSPQKTEAHPNSMFADCVRRQFPELVDEIASWANRKLQGVDVILSSLHVLTTMSLVDDETWLMALRNISIGLSYVSSALGEAPDASVSRMVKWSKVLVKISTSNKSFSLSVPSIGSKVDYSWMTPVVENGKADVSSVKSWAVYTAYGVRHNAEVA